MGHYDHPLVIVFVNFKNRIVSKHGSHNNLLNMAENSTYTDSTMTDNNQWLTIVILFHSKDGKYANMCSVMRGTAVLCIGQCAKTCI